MQPVLKFLTLGVISGIFLSCSEDADNFTEVTTIKVINLINDVPSVIVKTGDGPINYALVEEKIDFDASKNFTFQANINRAIEVVKESDTLNPIYSESLNLKPVIHSLYFSGFSDDYEHLLVEDHVKQFTDSLVGIRFMNFSKNEGPIDISISGETSNIVSGLDFKAASDFIEFPAKAADGGYNFEFRDALDGVSYFTLDPLDIENIGEIKRDVSVKKNVTLVLRVKKIELGAITLTINDVKRVNSYHN